MKKITLTLIGATMLTTVGLSFDDSSDFKKFMTAETPKMAKAFEKKDVSYFEKASTADFGEMHGKHKSSREEAFASLKQFFGMATDIKSKFTLIKTSVKGNVATAWVSSVTTCKMGPPPSTKGKSASYEMDDWETQTWVKSGKTWKIKMLEDTKPMVMKMNGKPVDPKMMGGG